MPPQIPSTASGTGRLFNPLRISLLGFYISHLLVSSGPQKNKWRQLQRQYCVNGYYFFERIIVDSVAVSIDGACRGNGTENARAAWGVYFDANSPYNCNGRVPDGCRQTSQFAEIYAAIHALGRIETVIRRKPWIKHILLVTDSSYLAHSMSKHVFVWQENGWKSTAGGQVTNERAFKQLHSQISKLERDGISVQFWQVPRESNKEADSLANLAFEL